MGESKQTIQTFIFSNLSLSDLCQLKKFILIYETLITKFYLYLFRQITSKIRNKIIINLWEKFWLVNLPF